MRNEIASEIRRSLTDPAKLCRALGLAEKAKRQSRGLSIRCPSHGEREPSCSVTLGPDGTVRVRCFSCGFTGDALTLVAVARGLSPRGAFREVLFEAAQIAGRHDLAQELASGDAPRGPVAPRKTAAEPVPTPEAVYPDEGALESLWGGAVAVTEDPDASGHLVGRRIDPELVARLDLARVLRRDMATDRLPRWARYQGVTWRDSGHRMLVRVWDSDGAWRSVRAWRVRDGSTPKRLPPGGCRASGLVLANAPAVQMLRGEGAPTTVVVVEGEPDMLARAVVNPWLPVLGVLSGSWHQGFADRVPFGSEVVIRTHLDAAGDRYADEIARTLASRAQVYRLAPETEEAA